MFSRRIETERLSASGDLWLRIDVRCGSLPLSHVDDVPN